MGVEPRLLRDNEVECYPTENPRGWDVCMWTRAGGGQMVDVAHHRLKRDALEHKRILTEAIAWRPEK